MVLGGWLVVARTYVQYAVLFVSVSVALALMFRQVLALLEFRASFRVFFSFLSSALP